MKKGFSLIELVIAIGLASVISTTLYMAYMTILHTDNIGEEKITTDIRNITLLHQLEKDLTGIFIPYQALPEPPEPEAPKKTDAQKKVPDKPQEKKAPRKVLEKPFFSSNDKSGNLDQLTFITSTVTNTYQAPQSAAGTATAGSPHYARVMYRMKKESGAPESFSITRQESDNLNIKSFDAKSDKSVHAYEVITGIRSLKISYLRPKPQQDDKKKKEKPADKAKKKSGRTKKDREYENYETLATWPPEELTKKDAIPDLPHMILVELTLWNTEKTTDITTRMYVPSFVLPQLYPIMTEQPEQEEKKKDKDTAAAQPGTTPTPQPNATSNSASTPGSADSPAVQNNTGGAPSGGVTTNNTTPRGNNDAASSTPTVGPQAHAQTLKNNLHNLLAQHGGKK